MERVIPLNNVVPLSYPIMFCYGLMKAPHRRTTSLQTWLPTSEGVMVLSFYLWWQGGTVGHPLSCCNCCFCTTTCLKLSTTIPQLQYFPCFPSEIFPFSRRKRQELVRKVSSSQGFFFFPRLDQIFTWQWNQWKRKRPIQQWWYILLSFLCLCMWLHNHVWVREREEVSTRQSFLISAEGNVRPHLPLCQFLQLQPTSMNGSRWK